MNLFAGLMLLAVVAWAGLFRLSIGIDDLLADTVTEQVAAMTHAIVNVGSVKTTLSRGKGIIDTLVVANPAGFRTAHALKADNIEVHLDLASLASDVVVIRLITINGPDVNYEHGATTTNFDAIQDNIAAYLDARRRKYDHDGKRLIVEEFTICNATAQASARFMGGKTLSIPLPDITLRNIGKDRGGVSPAELGRIVTGALKTRLSDAANVDRLARATDEVVVGPRQPRTVQSRRGAAAVSRSGRL